MGPGELPRAFITVMVVLCWAGTAAAQVQPKVDPDAPQITTTPSRDKVELGEPFEVTISVLSRADMNVNLPAGALDGGPAWAELGDRKDEKTVEKDGAVRRTWVLTVGALDVGVQTFPGLMLTYEVQGEPRTIQTAAFSVEVTSVIGAGKEELRPVASPVAVLERDWTLAWAAAGVLVAGAALAFGLVAWRAARRRRPAAVAAAAARASLPPAEAALARLAALGARTGEDDLRPLYFELTEIVREYAGARWGFAALEQTSEEVLLALRGKAGAGPAEGLGELFAACDLVKYARVPAARADAEAVIARAVAFVETTRPRAVEPAPAAPDAAPVAG